MGNFFANLILGIKEAILLVMIIIILVIAGSYFVARQTFMKDIIEEDEALGYKFTDTVWLDPITGMKLPKAEKDNDHYYDHITITAKNGKVVTIGEIKEIRNEMMKYSEEKTLFNKKKKRVEELCEILVVQYCGKEYEIIPESYTFEINNELAMGSTGINSVINRTVRETFFEKKYESNNG